MIPINFKDKRNNMMWIYRSIFLFSLIFILACEDSIQGPEDEPVNRGPVNMRATFSNIQTEVFSKSCATPACHSGTQAPTLSAGQSYGNLVNQASLQNPSLLRVKPGDSNNSYLMKKLTGDGTSIMPPSGQLSEAKIDSIALWINNGALNN
jgi:hypothetical protein